MLELESSSLLRHFNAWMGWRSSRSYPEVSRRETGSTRTLVSIAESHPKTSTTLTEATVLIEHWRKEYNQVRPHTSLGYRQPAPGAIITEH